MNQPTQIVRGIILPDGTLELAERLTLPTGEVEVTLRPVVTEPRGENWFECLQRIRAEREAAGYPFRTKEEIDADLAADRDWGEDRLENGRGQAETEPPPPEECKIDTTQEKTEGYGPYLARIRARREADGFPFRTKDEIDAEMQALRSWPDRSNDSLNRPE